MSAMFELSLTRYKVTEHTFVSGRNETAQTEGLLAQFGEYHLIFIALLAKQTGPLHLKLIE